MGHYSDITVIISNALPAPRHIVKKRRQTEWQTEWQTECQTEWQTEWQTETDRKTDREGKREADQEAKRQGNREAEKWRERADREMNEPTHLGELLTKLIKFNLQWCSLVFLLA